MIDNFMGQLDELEYRRHQRAGAIGGSGLVKIRRLSVAHYLADLDRMASRPAVGFGNVVHTAALEPDQFAARYYVKPEVIKADVPEPWKVERPNVTKGDDGLWRVGDGAGEYATKTNAAAAAKAVSGWTIDGETFYPTRKALAEQCGGLLPWTLSGDGPQPAFATKAEAEQHLRELAGDKQPISVADMLRCDEIVRALRAHPVAGLLLADAVCEEVVLWHDAEHGLDCSGKLDARRAISTDVFAALRGVAEVGQQIGIDLKTTGKLAQPDKLARMCHDAGWHVQAAHYVAGAAACGVELSAWVNIVVETEAPYGVAVVVLDDDYLALGRYERDQALVKVKAWRESGKARGYDPAPVVVSPPAWALPLEVEGREFVEWRDSGADAGLRAQLAEARVLADRAALKMAGAMSAIQEVAVDAARAARDGNYGRAVALSEEIQQLQLQAAEHSAEAQAQTARAAQISTQLQGDD